MHTATIRQFGINRHYFKLFKDISECVLSAVLAFVYLPYALLVGTDLIRPKWTEKQQHFSNNVQRELTKLCKLAGN